MKLGAAVAAHGAKSWLQRRRATFERGASLAELAEAELKSPLQRRKLDNLIERIGHQVTEQLTPVLTQRFGSVPDNEITAAILAVVDVLADADLSDKALLAADADPEQLARQLRTQFPDRAQEALLAKPAVYELALDQACRYLVQVVRYLPSFQPAALAEVLARLTAQSDQLDALLDAVPVTSLHAPRGTNHDTEFRAEYLRFLARTLDRLELLGLPMDEAPTLALTVAYLSLSVSEDADRTRGARRLGRSRSEDWFDPTAPPRQAEGVPVESAIGRSDRTLLRGDAGSGKTTLLNWLAVRAARNELAGELENWNGCVPFPVRLRQFATGGLPKPEEFVSHAAPMISGLMPEAWAHRQLLAGTAMLLVDGVDEVPAGQRRMVKTWLRELLESFPKIKVVVTSRIAAADHRWLAEENFASVTLEPMSPGNVLAFVERWHKAAETARPDKDGPAAQRRLLSQLERPHLRELGTSPLLCAMLCALNLAHRSELPRNRMDLYAKALAMLLHLRDAERQIAGPLGDSEKRVLLRDLAWRLTQAGRVELAKADALEKLALKLPGMPNVDADPAGLLQHLIERSGVLREPVPGRIDFVHRTFQEYLAADEAIQEHHVETLVGHAHLDTWWETIVMACGHATAKQAGQLLTEILDLADQHPTRARHLRLLAAACLETVQVIDPAVRTRVDSMIEQRLVPPRNLRETSSLAAIGHRVLRHLPNSLEGLSAAKAAATVRAAALTGSPDALPLLARYAQDTSLGVQRELEKAWHYFDPERFADVVLADSPLLNGEFKVTSHRFLPYVSRLRSLTSMSISLPFHEPVDDLRLICGLPAITELRLPCTTQPLNLGLLSEHPNLRSLSLSNARRFTGLHSLGELSELETLDLGPRDSWRTIDFLAEIPRLRILGLRRVDDALANLSPIKRIDALRTLTLSMCSTQTLANTGPIDQVRSVMLSGPRNIVDLSLVLDTFPGATSLNLAGFDSIDLEPLTRSEMDLLILQTSNQVDLQPLAHMSSLRNLWVLRMGTSIDLSPLAGMNLKLRLTRGSGYTGLDRLGPGVSIRYWK